MNGPEDYRSIIQAFRRGLALLNSGRFWECDRSEAETYFRGNGNPSRAVRLGALVAVESTWRFNPSYQCPEEARIFCRRHLETHIVPPLGCERIYSQAREIAKTGGFDKMEAFAEASFPYGDIARFGAMATSRELGNASTHARYRVRLLRWEYLKGPSQEKAVRLLDAVAETYEARALDDDTLSKTLDIPRMKHPHAYPVFLRALRSCRSIGPDLAAKCRDLVPVLA